MSILSASKICVLAPLACFIVACSADAEPEPTTDPHGVTEIAETAKTPETAAPAAPERTGTATSALSGDQCCYWVYDWYHCDPTPCPGPRPPPY